MSIDHSQDQRAAGPRATAGAHAGGNPSAVAARDRRAGRATTIVLAGIAVVCVAGLALGISRVLLPATGTAPEPGEGRPLADAAGDASAASRAQPGPAARLRTSMTQGTQAAEPGSPASARAEAKSPGARRSRGSELAARLAARKAEQRAAAGEWSPGRRADSDRARRGSSGAPVSPRGFAAPMAGVDPAPESTGPSGSAYAPGYVEVVGVAMRTPGQRVGIQRGDRILEYNGQPVASRVELEAAWSDPSLPATVPILVESRNGRVETRDVPRGDLGLILPPRYNP